MLIKNILSVFDPIKNNSFTPLHAPLFNGNEEKYLVDCLQSNYVSSVGEYVDRFENMLTEFTGARHAVVAVNGTAALQVCLRLVGVDKGDEVLVPALSFIATANAVYYLGAIPHFVDVSETSLGIDTANLLHYLNEIVDFKKNESYNRLTDRRIKAIVPMHTFGHPVDMDALNEIADKFKLEVVEDAAESLGSLYKGIHTGNFCKVAALSFNGNKVITTGGGGAIITNDKNLAKMAKHITTTAKVPHPWEYIHDMIGYNYRMPAINAALGCAQLEQLPTFIEKKRKLAEYYAAAFKNIEGVNFFIEPPYARSNYWLNTIILDKPDKHIRDSILHQTNENVIMTRPVWRLINSLEIYKDFPSMDLSTSKNLEKCIINIPSSASLME